MGYAGLFSVYTYGAEQGTDVPVWVWGGLSGLAFYLPTLPLDRVKTVMMTQALVGEATAPGRAAPYATATACFRDLLARGGESAHGFEHTDALPGRGIGVSVRPPAGCTRS